MTLSCSWTCCGPCPERPELVLLTSPLLVDVPYLRHGFSTRLGGLSKAPGATLDLTLTEDPQPVLQNNRARFKQMLGAPRGAELVEVDQVHGTRVITAEGAQGQPADGLYTCDCEQIVGVRTADCVPVLLAALDARGRPEAVAAVHAGWRGATAGIISNAVEALLAQGAQVQRIRAAIGPCISLSAFEVGPEVIEAAQQALMGQAPRTQVGPRARPHLDLVDLCERLLAQAGLPPSQVHSLGRCTFEEPGLFFSYRRDRGATGRHLSAICISEGAR